MEVLERLEALGDRATWVRGNADRELVELARGGDTAIPDPVAPWAAAQLSTAHVQRLAELPHPVTLPVDGFGDVVFCHGTVSLRRSAFDPDRACDTIAAVSTYPDAAEWADFFVRARATDADALTTFAPKDGR